MIPIHVVVAHCLHTSRELLLAPAMLLRCWTPVLLPFGSFGRVFFDYTVTKFVGICTVMLPFVGTDISISIVYIFWLIIFLRIPRRHRRYGNTKDKC